MSTLPEDVATFALEHVDDLRRIAASATSKEAAKAAFATATAHLQSERAHVDDAIAAKYRTTDPSAPHSLETETLVHLRRALASMQARRLTSAERETAKRILSMLVPEAEA